MSPPEAALAGGVGPRTRVHALRELVVLAFALALLCGLMQNTVRFAGRLLLGRPLDHGVHAWWMTPLGDALVFVPIALVLAGVGQLMRVATDRQHQASVLLFPLVMTGILMGPWFPLWARVLLAAGISVRLAAFHTAFQASRIRRIAGVLASATALIGLPVSLWPQVRTQLDENRLPPPPPSAPNVLILLLDTVRASVMQVYGHANPTTPYLSQFAGRGVVFDRAFSTASYTLPSHASLFTGRWPHELSTDWTEPLDNEVPTVAEVFSASGYRTAGLSANRIYVTREFGLGRGFAYFEEHRLGWQQVVRSSTLLRAIANSEPVRKVLRFNDDLARVRVPDQQQALMRWLARGSRPYFAFINVMEAHSPYLPSREFAERFGWYAKGATAAERTRAESMARREPEEIGGEESRKLFRAYEGAIAELDAHLGRFLGALESGGYLENTIVVIVADHGEEFGEHGLFGHGNSLYAESVRVPLLIVAPGRIPSAVRVGTGVSIRDVPATLLDLAGLPQALPGASLRSLWEHSEPQTWPPALAEIRQHDRLPETSRARYGDVTSVMTESTQVIRSADGIEYFDLASDPSGVAPGDSTSERFTRLRLRLPPRRR